MQWLRGIAANLIRNHFRLRRHSTGQELPDRPANIEGDADQAERAERIGAVLAELPAPYEEVLRGKYLEQRSVADIAAGSGQSPKAIESLLTRARQAFRAAFADDEELKESIREGHP